MTKYYCDLCGEEIKNRSGHHLYELPIATSEDKDRVIHLDGLLLCGRCERSVYNAITNIVSKDCLERLRQLATDEYEDSNW